MTRKVPPHPWFECRPALLLLDGSPPEAGALGMTAMQQVWARMSDDKRQWFHRFICENNQSDQALLVIQEMREALQREGLE